MNVIHNTNTKQFEVHLDNAIAVLEYSLEGGCICFEHTFVPDIFRGKGIAAALAEAGLEEARKRRWKVQSHCSYITHFIERHPELVENA